MRFLLWLLANGLIARASAQPQRAMSKFQKASETSEKFVEIGDRRGSSIAKILAD